MTIAATIATAPLMSHHFGTLSVGSLPANLLALPAVAPAMWVGMISAAAAQVPGLPLAPFGAAQLAAARLRRPGSRLVRPPTWAVLELTLGGPLEVAAAYALLLAGTGLALSGLGRLARRSKGATRPLRAALIGAAVLLLIAGLWPGWRRRRSGRRPAG